jgi:hypothetical protein
MIPGIGFMSAPLKKMIPPWVLWDHIWIQFAAPDAIHKAELIPLTPSRILVMPQIAKLIYYFDISPNYKIILSQSKIGREVFRTVTF